MERLWRSRKEKLAATPVTTITTLSDALCTIIQHYAHASLQSLISFVYFMHAVETAQKALYGSLSIRNHMTGSAARLVNASQISGRATEELDYHDQR